MKPVPITLVDDTDLTAEVQKQLGNYTKERNVALLTLDLVIGELPA